MMSVAAYYVILAVLILEMVKQSWKPGLWGCVEAVGLGAVAAVFALPLLVGAFGWERPWSIPLEGKLVAGCGAALYGWNAGRVLRNASK